LLQFSSVPTSSGRSTRANPASPRARLFLALDLPDDFRAELVAWRDAALAGRPELRPVADEALHVTLVFLGYRPLRAVDRIAEVALDAAPAIARPCLTALDVRPLPPRRPRLFAIDLADEDGRAAAVQSALSEALEAEDLYKPERRPFWAHLTFARVKGNQRAEPLADVPPPPAANFPTPTLTLYRSLLSPRGARYDPLARREL
jgi:RNA 2',3'-cyclic 3'-phosphodiesterase